MNEDILNYYSRGLEKDRLFNTDGGILERIRTLDILDRHLPVPPATILDVGGGAGVYAFELAQRKYQVRLIDPVPLHIEQATEINESAPSPLEQIILGDARKIPYDDGIADIVLFFGPLYHLTRKEERIQALKEANRVLKKEGLVFAVGISRFASLFDSLDQGYIEDDTFIEIIRQDLKNGQHRNITRKPGYFTTAFFHHPQELQEELHQAGFQSIKLLSIEGPAILINNTCNYLADPKLRDVILSFIREIESEPTLIGAGGHIMAIGRK